MLPLYARTIPGTAHSGASLAVAIFVSAQARLIPGRRIGGFEVPLHLLGRLADKRSEYGIGFGKAFVIHRKGNPILYAYKDQPVTQAIQKLIASAGNDTANPIWEVTPFVDAPGAYPSGSYFFEWEREWRKIGDFKFAVEDVAFLIIPEHLHEAARNFFADAKHENLGPTYDCPYIDAHWNRDKIAHALRAELTQI